MKSVRVGNSTIQGSGVFADEDIKAGEIVWKFDSNYDLTLSTKEFDSLTENEKKH